MRKFEDKDYPVVCEWWKGYDWPEIPYTMLPINGLIIDNTCAGFLYQTDSDLAWIEFIVGNPTIDKNKRAEGLEQLIGGLKDKAKELGFKTVFTATRHERLVDRFKEKGFHISDKNMTHMIGRI